LELRTETDFKLAISPYSAPVQFRLTALRSLVLETAATLPQVGAIQEALKWGQPSFLTPASKSGSTIRIDGIRHDPEKLAMYFHCQSGLIEEFKQHYGGKLEFEGNRAIILNVEDELPIKILRHCISLATTHHLRKKSDKASAQKNDPPHHN
jgi:Domain of unknown function (DU1801)